jgi:AcrR family transcriptional regulator
VEVSRQKDPQDRRDRPYHHGNLRAALLESAVAAARVGGVDSVSLREVAHQVGVSPSAMYRHIPDRSHLLALVAQVARQELAATMIGKVEAVEATGDPVSDAVSRFAATGRGYIDFATTSTQLFRVAFHDSGAEPDGPDDPDPASVLSAALGELVEVGILAEDRLLEASLTAWSAVHGISTLLAERSLTGPFSVDDDTAVNAVLMGVLRAVTGLTAPSGD